MKLVLGNEVSAGQSRTRRNSDRVLWPVLLGTWEVHRARAGWCLGVLESPAPVPRAAEGCAHTHSVWAQGARCSGQLARLGWRGFAADPTGLHYCRESFKFVDKYRFNLDFKNFFSLIYDLSSLTELGHNFLYFYVSS